MESEVKYRRMCTVCKWDEGPMFLFPKDATKRESWRLFFDMESATQNMRLCSRHFDPGDLKSGMGRHRLMKNAFPRIKFPEPVRHISRGHTLQSENPKCVVPSCGNRSDGIITLHHFPRSYERRSQWATLINIAKVPSKHHLICSSHFSSTDFNIVPGKAKSLKSKVNPSVNLGISPDVFNEPEGSNESDGVGIGGGCEISEQCVITGKMLLDSRVSEVYHTTSTEKSTENARDCPTISDKDMNVEDSYSVKEKNFEDSYSVKKQNCENLYIIKEENCDNSYFIKDENSKNSYSIKEETCENLSATPCFNVETCLDSESDEGETILGL